MAQAEEFVQMCNLKNRSTITPESLEAGGGRKGPPLTADAAVTVNRGRVS